MQVGHLQSKPESLIPGTSDRWSPEHRQEWSLNAEFCGPQNKEVWRNLYWLWNISFFEHSYLTTNLPSENVWSANKAPMTEDLKCYEGSWRKNTEIVIFLTQVILFILRNTATVFTLCEKDWSLWCLSGSSSTLGTKSYAFKSQLGTQPAHWLHTMHCFFFVKMTTLKPLRSKWSSWDLPNLYHTHQHG